MSHWEPHLDLMRLLEALGSEVVATTEPEVRQACAERLMATAKLQWSTWPEVEAEVGSSIARTAKEVRELIEAVTGDPDDPEIDVKNGHLERKNSHHIHGLVERGRLTCGKQH